MTKDCPERRSSIPSQNPSHSIFIISSPKSIFSSLSLATKSLSLSCRTQILQYHQDITLLSLLLDILSFSLTLSPTSTPASTPTSTPTSTLTSTPTSTPTECFWLQLELQLQYLSNSDFYCFSRASSVLFFKSLSLFQVSYLLSAAVLLRLKLRVPYNSSNPNYHSTLTSTVSFWLRLLCLTPFLSASLTQIIYLLLYLHSTTATPGSLNPTLNVFDSYSDSKSDFNCNFNS